MQTHQKQQKPNMRPGAARQDEFYMKGVLQNAFSARIGIIMITVVCVLLACVIVMLISKPQHTVVIDSGTGKTYYAPSIRGTNSAVIDRQLVFYSARAAEDYFNYDFRMIQVARQNVYDLAGTEFRRKLDESGKYTDPNNDEIRRCIGEKTQSIFQWEAQPRVTLSNDPYYSTFMTFQRRVIDANGLTREYKRYNVKIDWGRLNENVDYSRRPHALVLLNVTILNEGSLELNEQLNRIR